MNKTGSPVQKDPLRQPLHGVAIYTPALLSREELVRSFVAHGPLLDHLLEELRLESGAGAPQHRLLIGPRGMGKTTLLLRLRYAVEDDPGLASTWLPLTFPEEQYNISHLGDLWLNCLDALGNLLEQHGETDLGREIDEAITHLPSDPEQRSKQGLALLLRTAQRRGRRLLLLLDNVDLVFDRLEKEDWALREVLSSERDLCLIGAASRVIESTYTYDQAFYDFFRIHELRELDEPETFQVLRTLARADRAEHVERLLDEDRGRIRTLRTLCGGNPRTVVLLYSVLSRGTAGDVHNDLEQLLDLCTPRYKARVEALPSQAQQVLDALALHWDPITAGELARKLGLPVNPVSTQLQRLVSQGVLEKVGYPSRRTGFQVAERLFDLWYLMRAGRRARRKLIGLVRFVRLLYSLLERGGLAADQLQHGQEKTSGEKVLHAGCSRAAEQPSLAAEEGPAGLYAARSAAELDPSDPGKALALACRLVRLGDWPAAAVRIRRVMEVGEEDFFVEKWPDILFFFREAVSRGLAGQSRDLLDEHGLTDRWRPLREALAILAAGDRALLLRLAPEVRHPAGWLVKELQPKG